MILVWIEGSLLLTQVAFIAVAASAEIRNDSDVLVSLGNDDAVFEQSVTFRGEFINYYANRAVDDDEETCSRTANTQPRWWRLTLKKPLNVSRILVIGGKDRRGQELQMDKINVTVAPDNQSSPVECKMSESLVVEDLQEWHEYNCLNSTASSIIHISDLRQISTEFSLCEIRIYEKIVPPDEFEQESLISDGQPSSSYKSRSNKMFSLGLLGCIVIAAKLLCE